MQNDNLLDPMKYLNQLSQYMAAKPPSAVTEGLHISCYKDALGSRKLS